MRTHRRPCPHSSVQIGRDPWVLETRAAARLLPALACPGPLASASNLLPWVVLSRLFLERPSTGSLSCLKVRPAQGPAVQKSGGTATQLVSFCFHKPPIGHFEVLPPAAGCRLWRGGTVGGDSWASQDSSLVYLDLRSCLRICVWAGRGR